MNCRNCGAVYAEGVNFCAMCGMRVSYVAPQCAQPVTGLMRLHEGRMIAGVCAGLSWYYGWDLALVRVIIVLLGVLAFPGIIAYLAAWLVVPEAPLRVVVPMQQPIQGHPQT